MTDQPESIEPSGGAEPPARAWRPSRRPDHRLDRQPLASNGRIVERSRSRGMTKALANFLRMPAVKVLIAVALFILAAIAYDATINGGSWTERPAKPKATAHAPIR